MKLRYILVGGFLLGVLWNGFLIQRDRQLFEAYDQACAELPANHPDCRYAK